MSLVQIVDAIVPEVFASYESVATTEKSALYQSGVIVSNANMSAKLSAGGRLFQTPFWQDLDNAEADIATDDPEDKSVPAKIGSSKHQFIRQVRTKSWSTADLTKELAGSDPAQEIAKKVGAYWGRQMDRSAIATIKGVIADNVANDASDMVLDITGVGGTVVVGGRTVNACTLHDLAFIDGKQLLGDMQSSLAITVMHSVVYSSLVKQNLIAFIPNSQGVHNIPTYLGTRVEVSDMCPAESQGGGVIWYTTYLCGTGVLGWAEKSVPKPVASVRDELGGNGMGIDTLVHRKQYALHPGGFTFTDAVTALEFPTNAELATASNWNRVVPERKMVPLVVIKTKNG